MSRGVQIFQKIVDQILRGSKYSVTVQTFKYNSIVLVELQVITIRLNKRNPIY